MNLSPLAIQKFFDNNGAPMSGGLLYTYAAGTTTKIPSYKNSAGSEQNTNPVVLDFRGECRLWLDASLAYKFVLSPPGDTDPPTNPIWTADNVTTAITATSVIASASAGSRQSSATERVQFTFTVPGGSLNNTSSPLPELCFHSISQLDTLASASDDIYVRAYVDDVLVTQWTIQISGSDAANSIIELDARLILSASAPIGGSFVQRLIAGIATEASIVRMQTTFGAESWFAQLDWDNDHEFEVTIQTENSGFVRAVEGFAEVK